MEQWRPFIPSLTVRVEGDAVLIRLGQVGVRSRQVTIAVCRRWARAGAAALRSTWRLKVPERFVDVFDRGCATFMRVHAAHFDMVQLRKGVSAPMAACGREPATQWCGLSRLFAGWSSVLGPRSSCVVYSAGGGTCGCWAE